MIVKGFISRAAGEWAEGVENSGAALVMKTGDELDRNVGFGYWD